MHTTQKTQQYVKRTQLQQYTPHTPLKHTQNIANLLYTVKDNTCKSLNIMRNTQKINNNSVIRISTSKLAIYFGTKKSSNF